MISYLYFLQELHEIEYFESKSLFYIFFFSSLLLFSRNSHIHILNSLNWLPLIPPTYHFATKQIYKQKGIFSAILKQIY